MMQPTAGRRTMNYAPPSEERCRASEFQCPNGWCISKTQVCDGFENCKGGLDEIGCDPEDGICGKPAFLDTKNSYERNPWMVMIHEGNNALCPGVLIDSLHVLTYKDCFKTVDLRKVNRYNVKPGIQHSSNRKKDLATLAIDAIIQHSTYNLIRLDHPLEHNEYLLPICRVPEGKHILEYPFFHQNESEISNCENCFFIQIK